jgi:hypothetical protein
MAFRRDWRNHTPDCLLLVAGGMREAAPVTVWQPSGAAFSLST